MEDTKCKPAKNEGRLQQKEILTLSYSSEMKNVWSFAFSFPVVLLPRVAETSGILIVTFQLYRYSCVYRLNESPLKLRHRSVNFTLKSKDVGY